jgi:hypothetical protein
MIKFEKTENMKISGKGMLKDVTDTGFVLVDEKEDVAELLLFSDIAEMIGKSVTISISTKETI